MKSVSRVRLFATPWTAAYQAPPSLGFSKEEYRGGVPLPSPKNMMVSMQIFVRYKQQMKNSYKFRVNFFFFAVGRGGSDDKKYKQVPNELLSVS